MALQLRGLISRCARGDIELVAPITGERDEHGRWQNVDLRVIDTSGDESTYRVTSSTPLETLAALRAAIDVGGVSYMTTPSLDIFAIFIDEEDLDEFEDLYEESYDELEEA